LEEATIDKESSNSSTVAENSPLPANSAEKSTGFHAEKDSSNRTAPENITLPASAVKSAEATIDKESSNSTAPAVRFAPLSHNNLYGNDVFCEWKTSPINDPVVASLLGTQAPNQIQKAALRESICVPRNETLLSELHLFSTEEAKACLSNVTLMVAGDSYNQQLFIGLSDIIIGNPSNVEIRDGTRRNVVLKNKMKVSWDKWVSTYYLPF
jgi:hypothetical protein